VPKHFCLKSGAYEKMNFEKRSISDKLFENGKGKVAGYKLKGWLSFRKQISQ